MAARDICRDLRLPRRHGGQHDRSEERRAMSSDVCHLVLDALSSSWQGVPLLGLGIM